MMTILPHLYPVMMRIAYADSGVTSGLKNRRKLQAYMRSKITEHKPALKALHIQYVFMTDDALLDINRQFLNHDTYTDIITFPHQNTEEELESEIFISTDRVRENAANFQQSYQRELHRTLFHGLLHLCDYKDKSKKEQELMRLAEEEWLNGYEALLGKPL